MNAPRLIRGTGLAALLAGLLFVVIQPIHPADTLASVGTDGWVIVHCITLVMTVLFLVGITGIFVRQVQETSWLGVIGFVLLSLGLLITAAFVFVEAFVEPLLAEAAPGFVEGLLGMVNGTGPDAALGALPLLWSASGLLFLIGCLAFGVSVLRIGILPRWASALFAFGLPVAAIVLGLLPLDLHRLGAVPIGLGLAGMGYGLWSERRDSPADVVPSVSPRHTRPAA